MTRSFASGVLALLLITPFATSAATLDELRMQLESLLVHIASLNGESGSVLGTANWCPNITRTLYYAGRASSRGSDVVELQRWLTEEGYLPAGNASGYFGPLTETAVKAFQCKEGIVCSGSRSSTGYGAVGPATRAAIARVCSTTSIVPLPPAPPIPPEPVPPPAPIVSWGTPSGEVIERYYPFNVQHGALLVSQSNVEENASQWANRNVSPARIDITWGTPGNWPGPDSSTEEFEVRSCSNGKRMLFLNAYSNENINQRYPIGTRKAEIRIGSGSWIDITSICGTTGQPYALANLISEPYTMRVWGDIYGVDGKVGRTFFWQHAISYDSASANACWRNDEVSTRAAIVQEEAWWDSSNGWMNSGSNTGSGTMGANGEPDGNQVTYVRGQRIGKDAGLGWTTFGGIKYCMKYQWDW